MARVTARTAGGADVTALALFESADQTYRVIGSGEGHRRTEVWRGARWVRLPEVWRSVMDGSWHWRCFECRRLGGGDGWRQTMGLVHAHLLERSDNHG